MEDVAPEQVQWLWRPYIPRGKITIIQGDPGSGKTTFVLALVSMLTTGRALLGEDEGMEPLNVIYQTAEDGLGDTIKPRLVSLGADCSRVLVIDESGRELTMSDRRLEQAIETTGAGLLILDPIQAYLGSGVDMHRANEVRPVFKQLGAIAARHSCAVVLIGHMNKMQGAKSAYRGLGSIDVQAVARSVLVVGRLRDEPNVRAAAHDKSSLAMAGPSVLFEIGEDGFQWGDFCQLSVEDVLSGEGRSPNKTERAVELLLEQLRDGPVATAELEAAMEALGISNRTFKLAKQKIGAESVKAGNRWLTRLKPGEEGKGVAP